MSHYETIKENYLRRRKYESDCIAAAKLFVRKVGNAFNWPDEHRGIGPLSQIGSEEYVVENHFAFNKRGRLRCVAQFSLDANSKPASVEIHLERRSVTPEVWYFIVAGVQQTFDLHGLRLIPDNLTHAILAAIKMHFEPDFHIPE